MANAVDPEKPSQGQGSFTFGVAAADKDLNSRKLNVYTRENLPYVEGKLTATEVTNTVKASGDASTGFEGEVKTKNFIEAEYIDMFSNRFWPPDVRKGEQIFLINFYDSDQWYWWSMGRDDNLRRGERFRLAISDDVAFAKELNDDNTWFMEMDTLTKKCITIQTSKSDTENPEKFRYTIKIDAKANTVQIMDDDNNEICLDSNVPRIYMRNKDNAMIDVNMKNIILEAPEDIILNAGRQIVRNAPVETNLNEQSDATTVMKAKNFSIVCDDSVTITAPSIGLNGAVVLSETLVSGHIQAEGYSTGSTSKYADATTDVGEGMGTGGGNTPIPSGGGADNRNCAAWDQVSPAFDQVAADLEKIDSYIRYGNAGDTIRSLGTASKMPINKGE